MTKHSKRLATTCLVCLLILATNAKFTAAKSPSDLLRQSKLSDGETAGEGLKGLRFKLRGNLFSPGNREGLAVRGECIPKGNLVALVPTTNMAVTIGTPTLFFYIPKTEAKSAKLKLYEENNDEPVYAKTFALSKVSGVVSLSLPNDVNKPLLNVDKNYRWEFSIVCDPDDSAGDPAVSGGIQRLAQSSVLKNKLQNAALGDRPAVYAEAGLWNDTLKTLAELRFANPNDAKLITDWEDILKSAGLDQIAEEPLIQCCKPVENSAQLN